MWSSARSARTAARRCPILIVATSPPLPQSPDRSPAGRRDDSPNGSLLLLGAATSLHMIMPSISGGERCNQAPVPLYKDPRLPPEDEGRK